VLTIEHELNRPIDAQLDRDLFSPQVGSVLLDQKLIVCGVVTDDIVVANDPGYLDAEDGVQVEAFWRTMEVPVIGITMNLLR
jgi:hypothetical protein